MKEKRVLILFFVLIIALILFVYAAGEIGFVPSTPDSGDAITDSVVVNLSISSENSSAFIDWDNSLIGWWNFEYYNSTGIFDNSSYNNFGTFQGTNFGSSNISNAIRGNGLSFDGVDDKFDIPDTTVQGNSNYTFSFWVKYDTKTGVEEPIISKFSTALFIRYNHDSLPNRYSLQMYNGTSGGSVTLTSDEVNHNDGQWHNVVAVLDRSYGWRLYADGINIGNASDVVIGNISAGDVVIGYRAPSQYLNGSMDEFMIFNRSLDSTEVQALYNATSFSRNFTNLETKDYMYNACLINSSGNIFCTETRYLVDNVFPKISNVQTDAKKTTATITWNTDVQTSSVLEYGTNGNYNNSATNPSYLINHTITLLNLNANTTYNFRINSTNIYGEENSSSGIFSTRAGNFYVDATGGNDSASGDMNHPWKTISKINSYDFGPGENIYFKKGEEWNETLIINETGNADGTINFGSYGSGNKPKLNLANEISGWSVYSGNIYVADVGFNVEQLFVDGERLLVAHYPNSGYLYSDNNSDSSNYIIDYNLTLTAEQIIGAELHLRIEKWVLDNFIVENFSDYNISLNKESVSSAYEIGTNEGYFLSNKLFFLDSAGEWFYDNTTGKVYAWLNDDSNPSDHEIESSSVGKAIEILNASNIVVENLEIQKPSQNGLYVSNSQNLTIRNLNISNSGKYGMEFISINSSSNLSNIYIFNNYIEKSAFNGLRIWILDENIQNITIERNNITQTANSFLYRTNMGEYEWPLGAGVYVRGANNTIKENNIGYTGYSCSVFGGTGNVIEENVIEECCSILDDGGGIYFGGSSSNNTIRNNIVIHPIGNSEGNPFFFTSVNSSAQGIYLDSESHDISIINNTVVNGTDRGINIHNSYNNTITNNTLYNNLYQLRMNEGAINDTAVGNITNNTITGNIFFSLGNEIPVLLSSTNSSIDDFGTFENNIYYKGSLYYIFQTYFSDTYNFYDYFSLEKWKSEKTRDLNGVDVSTFYEVNPYYFDSTSGSELITNGNFDSNISGWKRWYSTTNNISWDSECDLGQGCLEVYSNNESSSWTFAVYSGDFTRVENKNYTARFSVISENSDWIRVYDFGGLDKIISINSSVINYELPFTAPENLTFGLYFLSSTLENHYWLDNVSVKEVVFAENDPLDDSLLLLNRENETRTFTLNQDYCNLDNEIVSSSVTLNPYKSQILLSCFCNNDGVCNNRETNCTCSNDCGACPLSDEDSSTILGGSFGAKTFKPSKEELEKGYEIKIIEHQKIEIPFGNSKKIIEVKSVSEDKVVVSVDGNDYDISLDGPTKIDLDSDGFYDVEIVNNGATGSSANLEFKLIHEEVPKEDEQSKGSFIKEKGKTFVIILIVVGIIVFVLLKNKIPQKKKFNNTNYIL